MGVTHAQLDQKLSPNSATDPHHIKVVEFVRNDTGSLLSFRCVASCNVTGSLETAVTLLETTGDQKVRLVFRCNSISLMLDQKFRFQNRSDEL